MEKVYIVWFVTEDEYTEDKEIKMIDNIYKTIQQAQMRVQKLKEEENPYAWFEIEEKEVF